MEKTYQFKFESEAQREQLESVLLSMGIPFREVKALLAEEPGTEYQTVDPELLKVTDEDLEMIRLGEQQFREGKTVPWERVKADLQARIERLKQSVDAA